MTIKKRLFVSNILMLVIPALFSVAVLACGLALFAALAFPQAEYRLALQGERDELRAKAAELAAAYCESGDAAALRSLQELAQRSGSSFVLYDGQSAVWQAGTLPAPAAQLGAALDALGGCGTVSDGEYELYGAALGGGGRLLAYSPLAALPGRRLKWGAAGLCGLTLAAALASVWAANRFLTRFVFRHIEQPLATLAEGVRQIRDGKLSHRIAYTEADEFAPLCDAFNEMAQRLQASVEQSRREEECRKELLASISHDIRSPLTAICAYVEGLQDGVAASPEKRAQYLAIIQKKAADLDRLVKKLFLFSKLEMDDYPYDPQPLDAVREIADFIAASAESYRRQGLHIGAGPLPPAAPIEADPAFFHSILANLLDNSAKYACGAQAAASISAVCCAGRLLLYVDDNGPGAAPEALPRLFDIFYRSDPARKKPGQGSGLGLAIVAREAARMGGSVRAENRPEGGLRVILELPLREGGLLDETHPDH